MKTDDLIAMLASGPDVAAAPPPGARWRTAATLGAGLLASVALMAAWLGVRPNLAQLALRRPRRGRWPAWRSSHRFSWCVSLYP